MKSRVLSFAVVVCLLIAGLAPQALAAPKPTGTVLWGAETSDPWMQFTELNAFEQKARKKVSLFCFYVSTASDHFPIELAQAVAARGATPIATIEPWDAPLAEIVGGQHDALLATWASEIRSWNKPIWLRFAHEMNGDWYPWSDGANYAAAFRRVVDVFDANGATNVRWVWNPNVVYPGSTPLSSLYPGDAYVDWVGVDGYNFGTSQTWSAWQSPATLFGPTLNEVRALTKKPIVIAETASTEAGGSKSRWVQDLFSFLKSNVDVKAILWFNLNKETDWRIQSSAAAQLAFATGISDTRYGSP